MKFPRFAKGRPRHIPGQMNKLEQAYRDHLEILRTVKSIQAYAFEAVKLRLADRTFYTADFIVMQADDTIEFHECKSHWEDDARVKIKVAAETYPYFKFVAVKQLPKRDGGGWKVEEF